MFIGNRSFYKYNYRIPIVLNLYITPNSIFIHFYKDFLLNLPMFISVSIFEIKKRGINVIKTYFLDIFEKVIYLFKEFFNVF